jgi:hypothetical protein
MSTMDDPRSDEQGSDAQRELLCQLVYCSRATADVDDATVERIIEVSRRRNPQRGITGMLVYGAGVFFQWIEGPRDGIAGLLASLQADPRHQDIVMLSEAEEVRERLFPDWAMQRVSGAEIRHVLLDALGTVTDERSAATLDLMLDHLDDGQLVALAKA